MPVTVQITTDANDVPAPSAIEAWALRVLEPRHENAEVTIRVVGQREGRSLNATWRGRDYATNVLAFPLEGLDLDPPLLGDIVVCADVANEEAATGKISRDAHWAHLVVHGALHLLGYDHENDRDARRMEARERTILNELGYSDD